MPYGYRPQRPGGIDLNDPRKKRLPLTPEEDPYGGIVPDFEVDLPEPVSPLPQVPLTQPSTIGMQTGAKLPMEQWQTPPRDLTSLRAWYSGAAEVPGAPPAPEWGKRTPTYSRLNPPPPRQMQAPTPAPSPTAPVMPSASGGANLFGQLPSEQFQQRMQGLGLTAAPAQPTRAGMLASTAPTQAPVTPSSLQQARVPRAALQLPKPSPMGQLQSGTQGQAQLSAPMQGRALNRQEQQLRTEALLSGMRTEGRISAPTPAEQRAQAAAERSQIAGSVGGQTARALLSTPFDTPETRQKIAQTGGQFLNRVARGFGGTLANVPMGIGASTPVAAQAVEQDMAPVQAWLKRTFPTDAEQKDFVNAVLPETAGSLGAFMLGSLAGGGSTMSAAMMGALVNAGSTYEEVRQRGFSRENAIKAARFGRLIGAGEAFGVGRMIDKLAVARPMLGRALNTGEEGVQELISGWLNNANAKYASGYDPERALTEGLDEQLMGGLAGGALVETLGMGLAGLSASRKGGANKVPDALQTETGPAVQPPTGQFGGVIPPSAERQAYETWTQAGGPRAPEAYQVLRKSRSLPGQLGLPPVGLPPVGMPEGQAPQRPTAPFGPAPSPTVTPRTQVPTQPAPDATETEGAPFTFRPLSTVGRPEARPVSLFERPILQTTLEGQGAPIAQRIEEELPLIRDEYAETGRVYQKKPRKGEVGEEGPTAGNVRGEYGKLAYFMHRTPSGVLKKAVSAYDLEPTEKVDDAYEPVMNAIVADMQQIVPGVTASDVMASAQATAKARRALPPEVANIWESWYERFGQDRGFTESDLNNLKELTAGRRGPFFRPDVQAVMGVDPGDVEANKQTQTAIRQDLARLMKMPYDEISLTTVPPAIWQNWMSLRGLNDERQFPGLKAQMQEIFDRYNEEVRGVKPSPPSPPSAPAGAAPAAPTRPTPPPPAAPAAPTAPTAPSPLVTRYQSQVGRGVSRAPFAFQPRSYTEGVASIERARAEREEARQARERLKKGSPFAKARQAEEARIGEVIEGRRPEPPAATEPVTPKPTPPAPPAPAGEAVTPPTPRKATPVKKESAPKPAAPTGQPITEKSLTEQGWTKNSSIDFSGPNGERLERDANRRGEPWVYTDRSGNTESFASAREAIQGILSRPAATPAPETPVTPKTTKPRKAKAEAAPVPQTTQEEEGELPVAEFARQQEQVAARREAFLKDNPDLPLTREDYVKTLTPEMQQKYAKYEALRTKFEAAKQPGSKVRFGATSGKQMKELMRELAFIFTDVGRAKGVLSSVIDREPVNASTVDALGIKLPKGYQRQGNQFVFEEEAAPQTAQPINVSKIQKVLKGLRSGPMVDFTTIAGFKDSDLVSLRQYALKLLTGREMSTKDATFKRFMAELATALNVPVTTPSDTVKAVDKVLQDIEEGVITASTSAKEKAAPEIPTEVKQILDTLDLPQGKKSKTRKIIEAMHPDLGKKAIFVNDNIEQIIAEAEANGKVTKECP